MDRSGNLFAGQERPRGPLADRVRPQSLDEVVGHGELIGPAGWLRGLLERGALPHLVLWGPPGVGKTTIAQVLAGHVRARFVARSAVQVGVKEVREVIAEALDAFRRHGRPTVFFLDEIHRFNKAQQDALLGDVEHGTITLVGATTENPAFSLNNALLSRVQVAALDRLPRADVAELVARALAHPHGVGAKLDPEAEAAILDAAAGDSRYALTVLEAAAGLAGGAAPGGGTDDPAAAPGPRPTVSADHVRRVLAGNPLRHDRTGDLHYDTISAFIKTMRGSDVDAALYWGARLWEAGEDRRFLFRRLIIFASEDVGNADPQAVQLAAALAAGFERVGDAEGWILFAQAVSYLAAAPKSKASYRAYKAARRFLGHHGQDPVPAHLRNAPTDLAKELGHGEGYVDPHGEPGGIAPGVRYFPAGVGEPVFYAPTEHGEEAAIRARVEAYRKARARRRARNGSTGDGNGAGTADAAAGSRSGADPNTDPEIER